MAASSSDTELLFAVLALQAELIDRDQFVAACTDWSTRKQTSLADILHERGWLTAEDRALVEGLLQRKVQRHGGDVQGTLLAATTDEVRQSLAGVADPDVQRTLAASTPLAQGHVLLSTMEFVPRRSDRYTLNRVHAIGGIGRVWLARDDAVGREVAFKELRPERARDQSLWGRFLKEAQITGQLEHPAIVPVYELGMRSQEESPFYTMRFIRGRTLAEEARAYHLKRAQGEAGPLDLRRLLDAFASICNAVAYAHSRGVVHRDLKPQNVVLGDYGEVIVIDWGLAKLLSQTEKEGDPPPVSLPESGSDGGTVHGQTVGTPAYMSPEQAEGRLDLIDQRTDVYGLGAILYHILTGRPPFTGNDTSALLRQVIHDPPAKPSVVVAATPPGLEAACLRALAKKRGDRYGSAKQLAAEVHHWLADEPVEAYRDAWPVRLGRWARRRRGLVIGAAVFLLTSVVALSLSTGLIWQEQRRTAEEKHKAETEGARAEQNYEVARDLSVNLVDRAETGLARVNQAEPVRRQLLDVALAAFEKFLAQRPDDPELRKRTAQLYRYTANIHRLLSDLAAAEHMYRESIRIQETLLAQAPQDLAYRSQLAQTLRDYAQWQQRVGRLKEAHATVRQSVTMSEELQAASPGRSPLQRLLAVALLDQSSMEYQLGLTAEAAESCRRAADLYRRLEEAPKQERDVLDPVLASAVWSRLGTCLRELGKPREALDAHAEAIKLVRAARVEAINLPEAQHFLARALLEQSRTLAKLPERDREGEGNLDEAILLWQDLITRFQYISLYPEWQALAYQARGDLRLASKRLDAAAEDLEKSRSLLERLTKESPDQPEAQAHLGRTYAALGRLALASGKTAEAAEWLGKAAASLRRATERDRENAVNRRSLEEAEAELKRLGH